MKVRDKKSPASFDGQQGKRKSGRLLHPDYTKSGKFANYHLFALLGQAFCQGKYEIVDSLYDQIQSKRGAV